MMRRRRARFRTLTHSVRGEPDIGTTAERSTQRSPKRAQERIRSVRLSEPQRVGEGQADGGVPILSCLRKYLRAAAPVLVDIVMKVGDRSVRAGYQHLGNGVNRIADFAEELVLRPYGAAMLPGVVVVASDLFRTQVLGVELQNLGGVVIRPNDGMRMAHV